MALIQGGGEFDVEVAAGDDIAIPLTITENGAPMSWAGVTVTAPISHSTVVEWTVDDSIDGILVLSLTDTESTTLGASTEWPQTLKIERAGMKLTALAGVLTIRRDTQPGTGVGGGINVTVSSGPGATIQITSSGPRSAADVAFDPAGTIAATNMQAALEEMDDALQAAIVAAGNVPIGGADEAFLQKASAADNDVQWRTKADTAEDLAPLTAFTSRFGAGSTVVLFVGPDGDDAWAGALDSRPKLTVQAAVDALGGNGGKVILLGAVATTAPIIVPWRTTIEGVGISISQITFTGSAGEAAIVAAAGAVITHCRFRHFTVEVLAADTYCFDWSNFSYAKFEGLTASLRAAGCVGFFGRGNGLGSGPYYNIFDGIQVAGRNDKPNHPDQVAFQLLPGLSGGFGADGPNRNTFVNIPRISGVGTAFDVQSGNGNTGSSIHAESTQDYVFRFNNRPADYTGTATSGTRNTLTDSGAAFSGLSSACLIITAGTGAGTVAYIQSSTGTVITLDQAHPVAFDNTSVYAVYKAKAYKNDFRPVTIEGASGAVPYQNHYGGHSNNVVASMAESLGTAVWANEGQNQDSMFAAGKGILVPLTFWANNLAANTVTELFPFGGVELAVAGGITIPMTSNVHSVSTAMDEFDDAAGVGEVTIAVLRSGTAITALAHSLNVNNPYGFSKIAETPGAVASSNLRNQRLRVQATTDASWDQTGANVTVTVWIVL